MNQQESRQLMVIGATADPGTDQLPLYLDPVCVDPDDPSRCYDANVAPWDGSGPRLSYIPGSASRKSATKAIGNVLNSTNRSPGTIDSLH